MGKDLEKTQVIFYKEENSVFAYFLNEEFDLQGNKMCYAHIGQHSACSPDYITEMQLVKASKEEYQGLLEELESIGYNLEVLNND